MSLRDTLERLVWTVVAASGGALLAGPIVGVSAWQGAALVGLTAAINFVTIVGRARLAVLPDPGAGLPGLPADEGGRIDTATALVLGLFAVFLLIVLLVLTGDLPRS